MRPYPTASVSPSSVSDGINGREDLPGAQEPGTVASAILNEHDRLNIPDIGVVPVPGMDLGYDGSTLETSTQQPSADFCDIPLPSFDDLNVNSLISTSPSTSAVDPEASELSNSQFLQAMERSSRATWRNITGSSELSRRLPDPIAYSMEFKPVSLFSAMMHNALSLGFDVAKTVTPNIVSPFYRLIKPTDDPNALLAGFQAMPIHLRPTLPQILFPHHPYLDLIPYPLVRARLIVLTSTMPHIVNHLEFKRDVYINGGLVCWKTNGSAQPWDMRNWEAAPWFLKKWKMLMDGEGGEIWKQSNWWWTLRERLSEASLLSMSGLA